MTGFVPPILAALLIVAGMYMYFERQEKAKQQKRGQEQTPQSFSSGMVSASSQLEEQTKKQEWLAYAQKLEQYAAQVEANAQDAPNQAQLISYAQRLRDYAKRIRTQIASTQ